MTFVQVPLGELVTFDTRQVQPEDIVDGTTYVGLESMERAGSLNETVTVKAMELKSAKFAFDARHVLFGKLRPNLGKIARPSREGICSTDIYPVLPGLRLDRGYLAQFLLTPRSIGKAASQTSGANLPRISSGVLKRFEIPLPPLPEQRRIAAILDQADELRTKRRRALGLLDELVDCLFVDMFGDTTVNSRRYPTRRFGELGKLDRGISRARPRNAPSLLGGPYPLIQTGDVANSGGYIREYSQTYSELGLAQSKMWAPGTLAITIAANIAKTGLLTFPACFPDSVVGFLPDIDQVQAEFIRFWLGSIQEVLERQAPASAQKNINLAILRGLEVPVPPLVDQVEFTDRLAEIEHAKLWAQKQSKSLDELFASLQHRAFRGEL